MSTLTLRRRVALALLTTLMTLAWGNAQTREVGNRGGVRAPVAARSGQDAARPELLLQGGHSNKLNLVVFSPDGSLMASGGWDELVCLWDVKTGRLLRSFSGFTSDVSRIEFSRDGSTLAAAERRVNNVRVWNLLSGRPILDSEEGEEFEKFSPDSRVIATNLPDETSDSVQGNLRDIRTGKLLRRLTGQFIDFSPDGSMVVSGGSAERVTVEQIRTRRPPLRLAGRFVAFSPSGERVIIQNKNRVELWDTRSGAKLRHFPGYYAGGSPDTRLVATAQDAPGGGHTIVVWEADSAVPPCNLQNVFKRPASDTGSAFNVLQPDTWESGAVRFGPDRRFAVAVGMGALGEVVNQMWDIQRCLKLHEFGDLSVAGFSRDGGKVLLRSSRLVSLRDSLTNQTLFDFAPGEPWELQDAEFVQMDKGEAVLVNEFASSSELPPGERDADDFQLRATLRDAGAGGAVIWTIEGASPDLKITRGVRAMATTNDLQIKLWDARSGSFLRTLNSHPSGTLLSVFSPDETMIVSAARDPARHAGVVWDVKSGTPRTLEAVTPSDGFVLSSVDGLSLSPDGSFAGATYSAAKPEDGPDGETRHGTIIWSLRSGGALHTHEGEQLAGYAAAGRPQYITTVQGGEQPGAPAPPDKIIFRDLTTGAVAHTLTGESFLDVTGDGQTVATLNVAPAAGGTTCRASLRETVSMKVLRSFAGACTLSFSGDGKNLVVESATPGAYELWDSGGGRRLRTLWTPARRARGGRRLNPDGGVLSFVPGDEYIIGTTWGGVAWWRASDGRLVRSWSGGVDSLAAFDSNVAAFLDASGNRFQDLSLVRVSDGKELLSESPDAFVRTVGFNEDGSVIFAQGYYKGFVISARDGRILRSFVTTAGGFNNVSTGPGGKLITDNGDGTLGIWSAGMERLLAQLAYLGENEWVVVTPDGFFDGSAGAYRRLAWRFSQNTFETAPIESFFNEFYYPGLLAAVFADKVPAAPRDLARIDRRLPSVSFLSGGAGGSARAAAERSVRVAIEVKEFSGTPGDPAGGGARDLRLFRNGSLVKAWDGDVLSDAVEGCRVTAPGVAVCETSVSVVAGDNRLTAYAFNSSNVKSEDSTHLLVGDRTLERKGVLYVLTIGVDSYRNRNYDLNFAVNDVKEMAAEVERQQQERLPPESRRYSRVEVVHLLDGQATKARILKALARLSGEDESPLPSEDPLTRLRKSQPEDAVVVYFAGHGKAVGEGAGETTRGRFYLIPHDMGYEGPRVKFEGEVLEAVKRSAVSDRELERAFERVEAGLLLLVVDACDSGEALESEEWRRGPMNSRGLAQLAYEKGMYVLTASQGYQAAKESSRLGHGLLTYALVVEGLRQGGADAAPPDGRILLREWLDFAARRVPQMQVLKAESCRADLECPSEDKQKLIEQLCAQQAGQRPRVFYRREPDVAPFVVGRRIGRDGEPPPSADPALPPICQQRRAR